MSARHPELHSTRPDPHQLRRIFANPLLVGAAVILVTVLAVYISSIAENGLPFLHTYQVSVELPDADHLAANDEVRIGGARVGQVRSVTAVVPRHAAPYARVTLELSSSARLPVDSTVEVLPASILGAKYLALTPGSSHRRLPDGGTLPLAQARAVVELSDALDAFAPQTRTAIQNTIIGLGDALAGRGADLNDTIAAASRALPALDGVLEVLASRPADLAGLIRGAAATAAALAPVSSTLVSLLQNGSQTLAAIQAAGDSLGQALDELPGTESTSTKALGDLLPVLTDAAALTNGLRPAAPKLGATAGALEAALQTATVVLRRAPRPLSALTVTVHRLGGAAGPVRAALSQLTPAITSLDQILGLFEPAQVHCNVGGLFVRNVDSAYSDGDASAAWYRIVLIGLPTDQYLQEPTPAPTLHMDYYPQENAHECQAGNEPYKPGQVIGNPGPTSGSTQPTYPPPGVTQLAENAGVIPKGSQP